MKNAYRLLFASIMAAATVPSMLAVPAKRGLMKFTQPDGSVIEVLLHGDENFHYYTTADGKEMLMQTARQEFVPARLQADGTTVQAVKGMSPAEIAAVRQKVPVRPLRQAKAPRRAAAESDALPGLFPDASFPVKGEQKVLVVLVEYQDVKFNLDDPMTYFNNMLNQEGFSEYNATGSAKDWFKVATNDEFKPQFDLYGPLTLSKNMSYYGGNDYYGDDSNPHKMVIEACQQLNETVDFSEYDRDNDGYIDNVFVFYAGRGEATGGSSNTVWPHSYNVTSAEPGMSYKFDGVQLDRYACSNEWTTSDAGGMRPDGIGTFIHEFSHVMGLPDLYATSYTSSFTPGGWDVMDYGPYNNDGCTPPTYSGFERAALGYLQPQELSGSRNVSISPIAENDAKLITTSKRNEYFILENRQQTGWDTYIPGHGMLVWHIDYNDNTWTYNRVNNTPSHQYVDIIEADNTQSDGSRAGDAFPGTSNKTALGDATVPRLTTWTKVNLGMELTDIKEDQGRISFKLNGGGVDLTVPVGLAADSITASGFTAKWDAVEGATRYIVNLFGEASKRGMPTKVGLPENYELLAEYTVEDTTVCRINRLKPSTTYYFTVKADDGMFTSDESELFEVKTIDPTFDYYAPVAIEASDVKENSFVANWEAMDEAQEYFIDVVSKDFGEDVLETVDFTSGIEALEGWTSTSKSTYGMASYAGAAVPALRLSSDNDALISCNFENGVKSLSFWHRGNSTTETENIEVRLLRNGVWEPDSVVTIVTEKGGVTTEYEINDPEVKKVMLAFRRTTKGAVAIDDVCVTAYGPVEDVAVEGYTALSAGNNLSVEVAGLNPGTTYYYSLVAHNGTCQSLRSNTIAVTTAKEVSSIKDTEAATAVVKVSGNTISCESAMEIFDIAGRRIAQSVRSAELPSGIYIVSPEGMKPVKVAVK